MSDIRGPEFVIPKLSVVCTPGPPKDVAPKPQGLSLVDGPDRDNETRR